MRGFSFASLILSYFLVGGGMFTGTLAAGVLKTSSEIVVYLLIAAGAFLGGFVAGRASRGSTILEPAIGAVAVVATVVGLAASTPIGKLVWGMAQDQTIQFIAAVGGAGIGGAIAGAIVSEKLLGEATRSSVPWALYTALSTFGACLLIALFGSIAYIAGDSGATSDQMAMMMLVGMGVGCLLSGLCVGASARSRPLLAAMIGGGGGVAGFCALLSRASPRSGEDKDAATAIAVLAVGGAIVTLIGALIGWAAVGKRRAG
jgi:hypothetical protein